MSNAPVHEIDPQVFWNDPYPDLKSMRAATPVVHVPQLGATLITRHGDISESEKITEVFSSYQPDGLMSKLMGENMMRKDGADHAAERKASFPAFSPKTVKTVWKQAFDTMAAGVFDEIAPLGKADMLRDIARRISGEALKIVTGLTNMPWQEMDRVSQGMIDGIANYLGDAAIEANCHDCTKSIENYIDEMKPVLERTPDMSILSVLLQAGMSREQYYANVKLAISGGQNEVRDVIAGLTWTLLTHPIELQRIRDGKQNWHDAFDEYCRWLSPIGMSPRRIAKPHDLHGIKLMPEERIFLMFGSGNRDETVFENPETFDITRDTTASLAFGAGPHFCAGAWVSRSLIADVAMPMIFDRLGELRLDGEVPFGGWAFRGPLAMPVAWNPAAQHRHDNATITI